MLFLTLACWKRGLTPTTRETHPEEGSDLDFCFHPAPGNPSLRPKVACTQLGATALDRLQGPKSPPSP